MKTKPQVCVPSLFLGTALVISCSDDDRGPVSPTGGAGQSVAGSSTAGSGGETMNGGSDSTGKSGGGAGGARGGSAGASSGGMAPAGAANSGGEGGEGGSEPLLDCSKVPRVSQSWSKS